MKERRLFSRHSIGTRIAALFMLLILVITAVMTYVSISVLTNELLDNATEYTEQLIRRVNAELDMYVEYMKDISDFIVDNGAVAAYLRAANEHRLTDAACRDAQEQLAAAQKIRSEITAIALIPESGGALFGSEGASLNTYSNYQNADWYQAALQEPYEVQVSSSRVENLIAGQYNWVVSFSKAVFDRAGNMPGCSAHRPQLPDHRPALCRYPAWQPGLYLSARPDRRHSLASTAGSDLCGTETGKCRGGFVCGRRPDALRQGAGTQALCRLRIGGHRLDSRGSCLHAGTAAQSGQNLQDLSAHCGSSAGACSGIRASTLALYRRAHPPIDADHAARGGRRSACAQPGILPHRTRSAV